MIITDELNRLLSLESDASAPARRRGDRPMEFSVMFFSDAQQLPDRKYALVFDVGTFADRHGFTAVWLPERHFQSFGGIYPNPAVIAAALAVKTTRIRLRSGSVVLPLHHPAEVVEAWSIVDNLSNGRVDLGFASGWSPHDFVLSPGTYAARRQVWRDRIPIVRKMWRREPVSCPNGQDASVDVQIFPAPVQHDVAVWLVISKSDESFAHAGACGYHVLTMLQGIDLRELGRKIQIYRDARARHGFAPDEGIVSLMVHTLINEDRRVVEDAVRQPFLDYIRSALSGHLQAMDQAVAPVGRTLDRVVDHAYERYFRTGALFGSVADGLAFVQQARASGVNELACLMDFGVEHAMVLDSLPYLDDLRQQVQGAPASSP